MTLEKCQNFRDFITRRWLRLFPAMLICSVVIFASATLFPERPAGRPVIRDMLPGLTFIEPQWWGFFLGSRQGVIEGAFWSLFVEVKFYFIAGILYFLIGGNKTIVALLGLFLVAATISKFQHIFPALELRFPDFLVRISSAIHFGWFIAGALYYRYFHERKKSWLYAAMLVALASAIVLGRLHWGATLAAAMTGILFTSAVSMPFVQSMLSRSSLIFLGFVSYPLYLVHENMMIALIIKTGDAAPWMPSILIPVVPIAIVIAVGSLVAIYGEPWLREKIRPMYHKARFFMRIPSST
jgi:peptidoglycan/LPS O-acetylase OafA/YrhL